MRFTIILILVISNSYAKELFELSDNYHCSEGSFPPKSFCQAVKFTPWKTSEKKFIKGLLKELNLKQYKHLYQTIKGKGITKIHRVKYSSNWYANSQTRTVEFFRLREPVLMWVNPTTNVIGITDHFFNAPNISDEISGKNKKLLNLLHEIIHVFDIASNHPSSKYRQKFGWKWNHNQEVYRQTSPQEIMDEFLQILEYSRNIDPIKAHSMNRQAGIHYGVPTLYALFNTKEFFAEVLSYYLLDPKAKDYLPKDLQIILDQILEPSQG